MWEPKTVLRRMYLPRIQKCFSKIYTWDDSLVDGKTYFKFHYPNLLPMIDQIPSFEEKKFCTLVATDLKSRYEQELYSERRAAIRFFEKDRKKGLSFMAKDGIPLNIQVTGDRLMINSVRSKTTDFPSATKTRSGRKATSQKRSSIALLREQFPSIGVRATWKSIFLKIVSSTGVPLRVWKSSMLF